MNAGDFGNSLRPGGSLESDNPDAENAEKLFPKAFVRSIVSLNTKLSRFAEIGSLGLRGERGPSSATKG